MNWRTHRENTPTFNTTVKLAEKLEGEAELKNGH